MHVEGRSVVATVLSPAKDGDSQLQRWSSFIGIITAIIGNILISVALNVQRYAHIRLHEERTKRRERSKILARKLKNGYGTTTSDGNGTLRESIEDEEGDPLMQSYHSADSQSTTCLEEQSIREKSYLKSPYWWAGILLMTIGETGNFLAYGFAPASIVSPLGVVALISNCVIAPIMLKEQFRWRDFWGVVVAIGGAVTVVLSAKQQEKKLGPHEVLGAITTTAFEVYMGITIFLIIALMWASPKYGSRTILLDLGLVGLFGGYTALSTKGVASMLSATLWKAFTTPLTYCLVAILVGTAIMQVKYVNKALQRFDSTQVIPVQFVMFTLSVIIGSAVLYRDFEKTTLQRAGKFVWGCLLTFFGVFLITSGRSIGDDECDEDIVEEGAETIYLAQQELNAEENNHPGDFNKYSTRRIPTILENGDAAHDEESHRSSLASITSTSRPQTPRAQTNTSRPPSIRLTPTVGASRIALEEPSPLLANPWKSPQDNPSAIRQNNSAPSMTISPSATPPETQTRFLPDISYSPITRASTGSNPQTDLEQNRIANSSQVDSARPTTPVRHSIAHSILPGPFIPPLSSPLSAVVADTARREFDSSLRKQSLRRPRLRFGRSKSISQGSGPEVPPGVLPPGQNHDRNTEHMLTKSLSASNGMGQTDLSKRSRARSLGHAFGDFWRGKILRRDEEGESSGGV